MPDRSPLSGADHRFVHGRKAEHASHEVAPEFADHPAAALPTIQRGGSASVLLAGRRGGLKEYKWDDQSNFNSISQ